MPLTENHNAEQILREYFLKLNLKPGDRIPTHEQLSKILNIGSRPLREALSVLRKQGLIITRGRAGTILCKPQDEHIIEPIKYYIEMIDVHDEELVYARAVIESAIVQETCRNRTTKDLLLLNRWVELQSEQGIAPEQEIEFDKNFHLELMNAAHNKVFCIFAKLILVQFEMLYQRDLYPDQDRIRVMDHNDIIEAVYEHNEKKASELTRNHILRSLNIKTKNTNTI